MANVDPQMNPVSSQWHGRLPSWILPLRKPMITAAELWLVCLDEIQGAWELLEQLLSQDERQRASRFLVPAAREQYLGTRAALRLILSERAGIEPAALELGQSPEGKPYLRRETGSCRALHFNVSHSGRFGLIGVAVDSEIGVDLEQIHPRQGLAEMAVICFTPGERRVLAELPPAQLATEFIRLWTRKEAVLKASGSGIVAALQRLDTSQSWRADEPTGEMQLFYGSSAWRVWDLSPAPGYCGAVAIPIPKGKAKLTVQPP